MNKNQFIKALTDYCSANVFNPYTDICDVYDRTDAHKIRAKNLVEVLDFALEGGVDSIWIGRDLGHRGGRRTGLPLTDEAHLSDAAKKWNASLKQATTGSLFAERTARNVWKFVNALEQNIFMWNVFPFHPYRNGSPFTNRSHTAKERNEGLEILEALEHLIKPSNMVAIGNDAFNAANKLFSGKTIHKIRHPSYGGEKEFATQLTSLYKVGAKHLCN